MTATRETRTVAPDRLEELVGRVVTDVGAAMIVPLALVGDRLGLFTALADGEPVTAGQLARRTGLVERYLREWLLAMATAGYVTYEGGGTGPDGKRSARYRLSPEQAEAFTNPDSPGYVAGAFQNLTAATRVIDRLTEAFRSGEGIAWHEQHEDVFAGTERFFRPGYLANLTSSWIPALGGTGERLVRGARVADVGCGFGASTIIMAKAYPNSSFVGVDYHAPSIEVARQRAAAAGVTGTVEFRVAGAADLDGSYDFITFFDCLHDMPDPLGALRAARAALAPGGRVMLVEPMSWDSVEESINPLGRVLVGASMFICLPSGLSGTPAAALGNQAGPTRTLELAREAGFADARIAASTDFNLVYELAP
ncbi:methyltransferase domain-containing protein [Amycolatopsis cynarae]|uniref:Methyltransferase domain-containing protein n=1 Tax=Amycolatopsis cynarae TaxID=2995223 RepID=A0ABY7B6H4_9PSEU|nr:methyltransferase domain-containing protein [Amycolatopsis sp. HUAS 11-8]WAL66793.1 methyltransferase domain-containing protein [Amycolatopsis sp. HUAS 11-8]